MKYMLMGAWAAITGFLSGLKPYWPTIFIILIIVIIIGLAKWLIKRK